MKHLKLFVHIIALFCANTTTAQSYIPVPDSNAVWMQGSGLYQFYGTHPYAVCDGPLSFGRDTVINSVTYHCLYGQQICKWLNTYSSPPPPGTVVSGTDYYPVSLRLVFRQDIAQKKVYLYDQSSHKDTLLYDFDNLVVGQPYPATFAVPSALNLSVSSQYTIALGANIHRVWRLGTTSNTPVVELIEGVGTSQGFGLQVLLPFESMNYLHCFSKNGSVVYSNPPATFGTLSFPSNGSCDVTLSAQEQTTDAAKTFFFPNPADQSIRFQSTAPLVAYRMVDVTSREVLSGKFSQGAAFEIDLTRLHPGVYLVTVQDQFGYETTKSLIKR
jgi:hypothetical protein